MTIFIGIDQSFTSTGYCVIRDNEVLDFGVFKTTIHDGDIHDRANIIVNNITALCNNYKDFKFSMEGLSFGQRGSATRDLAGLQFIIINYIRFQLNILDINIISPKSIKKLATGSGGSSKVKVTKTMMVHSLPDEIKALFKTKYKTSTGLYDVTDAYYLAKYNQSISTNFK